MVNILYKKIYQVLLNFYRFRHAFKHIGKELGFFDIIKLNFLNFIGYRNETIYIKSLNMYIKPNFYVITTLIETFNWELYKGLEGLECVLDLGAYIGESAVYLSRHNQQVVSYEPSVEKFELLQKNTELYDNISSHNLAVVGEEGIETLTFWERDSFDFCSSEDFKSKHTTKVEVKCTDIQSVMKKYTFDGLKMDIEGAEYDILDALMISNGFTFKKGVIEFHFSGDQKIERQKKFTKFCEYLKNNNYEFNLYDNYGVKIKEYTTTEFDSALNLQFSSHDE